ncbi:FliM/FliN family flagellar motor C-terminal domain-containing protein [Fretibacter rubidus]|uniref:FliM/FliN family flagellar motor C-terminal domain-containing protein n=1 Tax=Fretibacter rubidus TaxID=570162 RepID=UPI00352BBF9A
MKPVFQRWLPENALVDGGVSQQLHKVIDAWSAHWFVQAPAFQVHFSQVDTKDNVDLSDALVWQGNRNNMAAILNNDVVDSLGLSLLGQRADVGAITGASRQVFRALSKHCVEDLNDRLAELFGINNDLEFKNHIPLLDQEGYSLILRQGEKVFGLTYIVNRDCLVHVRKETLGDVNDDISFGLKSEAIEQEIITIGSRVGKGKISLADAESMVVGDVFVLDSLTDKPMTVMINNKLVANLKCRLTQSNNGKTLNLTNITMDATDE